MSRAELAHPGSPFPALPGTTYAGRWATIVSIRSEETDATANEIRDGVHHEPSLHLRDIGHLSWLLNAIEAAGRTATRPAGPGRMPPHWSGYDRVSHDGIMYREDSLNQLAKRGYLTIERRPVTVELAGGSRRPVSVGAHWLPSRRNSGRVGRSGES